MSRMPPSARRDQADALASKSHWHSLVIPTQEFELFAYIPDNQLQAKSLVVYLEGDGSAWLNSKTPAKDSTPRNPLALKLALAHPGSNAVYLARPCQYIRSHSSACQEELWTNRRFSTEIVQATSEAVDILKSKFNSRTVILVGYSGGGAVALLVAARRNDVSEVITVAGNLDTLAWTKFHGLGYLDGSLNPIDFTSNLAGIPQWHFVGGKDANITAELVQGYASHFNETSKIKVILEPDYTHHCCWVEQWPALWEKIQ